MDLTQIYMTSPDWIKGLMVILPFLTAYGMARLFAGRDNRREGGRKPPLTITVRDEETPSLPVRVEGAPTMIPYGQKPENPRADAEPFTTGIGSA